MEIIAIVAEVATETKENTNNLFQMTDGFWATVGVIVTALATFMGGKYLESRKLEVNREATMEREIRRLRLYSWANTRRVEIRLTYLESALEAEREYSEQLRSHINLGYGPPAPERGFIQKPKIELSELVDTMTSKEIDEEIERIIEETGGADTGPIETIK